MVFSHFMNSPSHTPHDTLATIIDDAARAIASLHSILPEIRAAIDILITTLQRGGKVLSAGNGGSAAEAMHLAEELSGRYKINRRALPGLSLCSDGTALTCIANDYGFENVFARQVEAFGKPGDVLVLFSTSGNSPNLRNAILQAKSQNVQVISLLGQDGGAIRNMSDVELIVPKTANSHVQEAHQVILHMMLEKIDAAFAPEQKTQ